MGDPLSHVLEVLRELPAHRRVLTGYVDLLRTRGDTTLGVKGSIARGRVDEYADIDLVVLPIEGRADRAWQQNTVNLLGRVGRPLSIFRATHIPLPNLWVSFLDIDGTVVKLDVDFAPEENVTDPAHVILFDPTGRLERILAKSVVPRAVDLRDLFRKFTGWSWYTYTKAARGELLEAMSSLEIMRADALLPFLQRQGNLPDEGFRWLEERLSGPTVQALASTYPSKVETTEVVRALLALIDFFVDVSSHVIDVTGPPGPPADLSWIRSAIVREAARL